VPRPRLGELLAEGMGRKLTLISAPAGFGKTTLLSEWRMLHSESDWSVGWVSLDEGDDDLVRFLSYLVAALQTIEPEIGQDVLLLLRSPQPSPVETVMTALINDVAQIPQDFALILDDFHVITNEAIHHAVAFFLEHLPPQAHLVIASRTDPPFPLARLRARGQMTEINAADLRFTPEEAAAFLRGVMGLDLSGESVAALDEKIEGWIAGLQLAALSARGREDASHLAEAFTGSNRHVFGYLAEEVLDQQPDDVQNFLLQTSVLERLSPPLCDAVTGRGDGQEMLERVEEANLFTVALDDAGHWYRYHHLFADALRRRLRQSNPELEPELHLRASEWYEREGFAKEAVRHALNADDSDRAALLMERHARTMLARTEMTVLSGWISALPAEVVCSRPRLCLAHCWLSLLDLKISKLALRIEEAERALKEREDSGELSGRGMGYGFSSIEETSMQRFAGQKRAASTLTTTSTTSGNSPTKRWRGC
jgi:LuxR family maltose regulon positive regulatory protein